MNTKVFTLKKWLYIYSFELLLFALIMVIFNKIFIYSDEFYTNNVWPANMLLLGMVCMGIFHNNTRTVKWIKNSLFVLIFLVPFFSKIIFSNSITALIGLLAYLMFNGLIFIETLKQIVRKEEITESVIFGSLSGFLLLIVISTFSFLLLEHQTPGSLNNILGTTIPEIYHQIVYFSSITLSTIGYGDITPKTDNARLLAAFWGIIGQFYMVTIVAIIISKFTSKKK